MRMWLQAEHDTPRAATIAAASKIFDRMYNQRDRSEHDESDGADHGRKQDRPHHARVRVRANLPIVEDIRASASWCRSAAAAKTNRMLSGIPRGRYDVKGGI
jgi:hypothetical protein